MAGWTIGASGLAEILAIGRRLGLAGFLLLCLWSVATFGMLGAAWAVAVPAGGIRLLPHFAWARALREAVSDLLPFSQLGGIVVGTRSLTAAGIAPRYVYGALMVDITTEMASQLVYTLFGLALMASLLMDGGAGAGLRLTILGGTGVMVVIILGVFATQRFGPALIMRIAGRVLPARAAAIGDFRGVLAGIYARRGAVTLSFLFNLAAWVMSGAAAWLVLRLMAVPISLWDALSLESLIFTLRSVAFMIPGAIGVQEAAYVVAAPLFGLPVEAALALSFAKRAREVVLGLPCLLIWQFGEMRAVTRRA